MISRIEDNSRTITVRTFKYNGDLHRHWLAHISRREDSLIVLDAKFEEEIQHPLLGTIGLGTISIEYYWLDRWYNIFRFLQPTGDIRYYYCNINVPPAFDGNTLSYIDLDIDILVMPDFSYRILDEDEFDENAARFNYPLDVQQRSRQALNEIVELIELRKFPFDGLK